MNQQPWPRLLVSTRQRRIRNLHGLVRIGRGYYVRHSELDTRNPTQHARQVRLAQIQALAHKANPVFRGLAAALIWGVDLLDEAPTIEYTREGGAHRLFAFNGDVPPAPTRRIMEPRTPLDCVEINGVRVATPIQAIADIASTAPAKDAIVAICGLLRLCVSNGHTWRNNPDWHLAREREAKAEALMLVREGRSARACRRAARLIGAAFSQCDSPAEALALLFFRKWGFPQPAPQYRLDLDDATYYADFCWASRHRIVEFDGFGKVAANPRQMQYMLERSAAIAHAGWKVLHITWRMLANETELAARLATFFPKSARLSIRPRKCWG